MSLSIGIPPKVKTQKWAHVSCSNKEWISSCNIQLVGSSAVPTAPTLIREVPIIYQ